MRRNEHRRTYIIHSTERGLAVGRPLSLTHCDAVRNNEISGVARSTVNWISTMLCRKTGRLRINPYEVKLSLSVLKSVFSSSILK